MQKIKNFRKRTISEAEDGNPNTVTQHDDVEEDEEERRLALEEVKFLQKQRKRKYGIPALPSSSAKGGGSGLVAKRDGGACPADKVEGGDEKEELVLQDTFAQETAVMVEDPNMVMYVEQELAKKRGKNVEDERTQVENELKRVEDELYKIPDHLKVKKRSSEESSTQWTTGIAEVQLPIEYKLKNIEETEAAKKLFARETINGPAQVIGA